MGLLKTIWLPLVMLKATALGGESKDYELKYRFNQPGGTQSSHTFLLKWNDPDSSLNSIEIMEAGSDKKVQTITFPPNRVKLIWRELVGPSNGIRDKILEYIDYNFDSFGDLRLTQVWPYKAGQKKYLVWLFDDQSKTYQFAPEISRLDAPVPDAKAKLIHSTTLGEYGGGEFTSNTYSVDFAGTLLLETQISQTIKDPSKLTFVREVNSMTLSTPRLVCRMEIPTEGRPKIIWGLPETCEDFMLKPSIDETSTAAPATTVAH
ncbi:MAG: hypothetical protein FJ146_15125 [Deltaproteobacteria bacterium]|nr:hypothetical protein [Deltaproteobacteria bacterium]